MLSNLSGPNLWRSRRGSNKSSPANPSHPDTPEAASKAATRPREISAEEEASLGDLNSSLAILTSIFPEVSVEVFREMLGALSEQSRLELVTERMLKGKDKCVRGRWRVTNRQEPDASNTKSGGAVAPKELLTTEMFRSSSYKAAVKTAFYHEFKSLSHSTIKAVLAENNYSYTESRPILIALMSKSWKFSFSGLFLRRKPPPAVDHPLLTWSVTENGNREPRLNQTSSDELNQELHETVISPIVARMQQERLAKDRGLAELLNEQEAVAAEALYDCECCFIPNNFENVVACDFNSHFICFRCVKAAMSETLFGQGWAKSSDPKRCTLKCIALDSTSNDGCGGSIPQGMLRHVLLQEPDGEETWRKFEDKVANENILQSQMCVIRCPFCTYAEEDATLVETSEEKPVLSIQWIVVAIAVLALILKQLGVSRIFQACLLIPAFLIPHSKLNSMANMRLQNNAAVRMPDAKNGTKFTCRNPLCSRSSCLRCSAAWIDIHVCYQSTRQALKTYVEGVVTEAVKRTCPKCHLSFIKSSGCNKLICVCGYSMCYVCRRDLSKEGYKHFCPHFRPNPGEECTECDRCDLYKTEDEEVVIARAKARAIQEWKEKEGSEEVDQLDLSDIGLPGEKSLIRPRSSKSRRWL